MTAQTNKNTTTVHIDRAWKKANYTIGRLYIDGELFCNTLEDKDRGLTKVQPLDYIREKKVYGKTAIPMGTYELRWTYSPKYKRNMFLVDGVPGFEGIRIHSGNTQEDTSGCVLLGLNTIVGRLTDSRATVKRFEERLCKDIQQGKRIYLTIS